MGWGTPKPKRPPRDPILVAMEGSPERRVRKWHPLQPKSPTPRAFEPSPAAYRPDAAKAIIEEVRQCNYELQPSIKSQFDRAAMIARSARQMELVNKLRRQSAAKAVQRAELVRQQSRVALSKQSPRPLRLWQPRSLCQCRHLVL